jgi:hypothetical protein
MSADTLLSKLDKVKRTGTDRWIACCPAHEDRSPSLAIRELQDGRILVHCFAECSVESILSSVGLEFDALFPPKPIEHAKRERRPFNAFDVLECLENEARIAAVASANLGQGLTLTPKDHERLLTAAVRLESGRRLANGEL